MPVLIIGAACDVGRELAALLRAQDAQVRVYVEEDDSAFRAAGCKVAIGELDDIGRIESAMEQVHTVVHLAPGPEPPAGRTMEWLVEETTDVAVRAAVSADVVRFLAASEIGAGEQANVPYFRSRGRADALILGSGLQHAVLRCTPSLGPNSPLARLLARAGRGIGAVAPPPGTQRLNPIWTGDVAHALFGADARGDTVSGVWDIGGPEVLTFDDLVERATGRSRIVHRRHVPGLARDLAIGYQRDCVADSGAFAAAFGFIPNTSLDSAIARCLPATD